MNKLYELRIRVNGQIVHNVCATDPELLLNRFKEIATKGTWKSPIAEIVTYANFGGVFEETESQTLHPLQVL
jgi:hypothetical protein